MSSAAWPALSAKVAVKSPSPALVRLPRPTVPPDVGHQVIEAAERGRDVVHGALELGRVGDVGHRGGDGDAPGSQPLGGGGQAGRVPGDETDGRALGGERLGHREADAPASPGDQRAAAAQAKIHGSGSYRPTGQFPAGHHDPATPRPLGRPRWVQPAGRRARPRSRPRLSHNDSKPWFPPRHPTLSLAWIPRRTRALGVARVVAAVEPFDEVERRSRPACWPGWTSAPDVCLVVTPGWTGLPMAVTGGRQTCGRPEHGPGTG